MDATIGTADLEQLRKDFAAEPAYRLAQNAVTQTSIDDLLLDREVVVGIDHTYSHKLDDWKVTNQKKSGRCWLFAGLNLLRVGPMKQMGLKDFEFSQNHLMFWDKVERANYFLEAVIETAHADFDDRTVACLLDNVASDGGQWDMFVALVRKHGLVPKAMMPETQSSSNTARMNQSLCTLLRGGALRLREVRDAGVDAMRERKGEIMSAVYRIVAIHLGTPPDQFTWQWTDKDGVFHRDGPTTPQEFAEGHVTLPIEDYVSLVHDPRPSSPFGHTYTVDRLGNVIGGPQVVYLNVEMDVLKGLAQQVIEDGEPVWFGCDVAQQFRGDLGIWDARLYDFESLYGTSLALDKASRLAAHETQMTHAMLLTGVDVVDGRPRRWRVENSWGDEKGREGFYAMNDSWFDEYVFEVAVRRDRLPAELRERLGDEPTVLPAWDPMGALAR